MEGGRGEQLEEGEGDVILVALTFEEPGVVKQQVYDEPFLVALVGVVVARPEVAMPVKSEAIGSRDPGSKGGPGGNRTTSGVARIVGRATDGMRAYVPYDPA